MRIEIDLNLVCIVGYDVISVFGIEIEMITDLVFA